MSITKPPINKHSEPIKLLVNAYQKALLIRLRYHKSLRHHTLLHLMPKRYWLVSHFYNMWNIRRIYFKPYVG